MKISLIEKYVGYKLAKLEPMVAQLKAEWGEEEFFRFVSEIKPFEEFDSTFRANIEATLRKRFKVRPHKCVFYKPSMRQWLADVTCQLTKDDILDAISQMSGLKKSTIEKATLFDNTLYMPLIEDMTEMFEAATGKVMLQNGYLWHMPENYTYQEMAEFFATA